MAKAAAKKKREQTLAEALPALSKATDEITVPATGNAAPAVKTKRATKTKTTPKTKATSMATATVRKGKTETSKSQQIREALKADPSKTAAEIASAVGVTPALVYNVKASMNKKAGKPKGKPGRKPGTAAAAKTSAPVSIDSALDSAFTFVTSVGGLLQAEQLLDKLKTIKDRL